MPIIGAEQGADALLETERLILRRPERGDLATLLSLLQDGEVARYTAHIPHPYGAADGEAWLAAVERGWAAGEEHVFVLADRASGALRGGIGLTVQGDRTGTLGYWLGRPYWGQGLMTEAADRMLRYAFDALGLAAVRASNMTENPASGRIQEKLGMVVVGQGVEAAPARGGMIAVTLREITRDAWRRRHPLPVVLVAAVALVDGDGRVLLAQRPHGKPMAGLWEFPGGKIGSDETPEAALTRELKEELDIDVTESCLGPFTFASHRYERFHLLMPLYLCRIWRGTVRPLEGQVLKWVRPADMDAYPMPPADIPLVAMLRDVL